MPLRIYFRGGIAKVEMGLGKGKRNYDKRESKKRDAVNRDIQQELNRRG